jgi:hypothetical protein
MFLSWKLGICMTDLRDSKADSILRVGGDTVFGVLKENFIWVTETCFLLLYRN